MTKSQFEEARQLQQAVYTPSELRSLAEGMMQRQEYLTQEQRDYYTALRELEAEFPGLREEINGNH
jgi:hypothetical protein